MRTKTQTRLIMILAFAAIAIGILQGAREALEATAIVAGLE